MTLTALIAQLDWLAQPAIAFVVSRAALFTAGIVGDVLLPTEEGHWVADPNSTFLSLWAKWDSQWYVQIARDGYWFQPLRQSNVAFFPLYPLAMRLLAPLVGENLVLAGFLISNAAFLLALIFLYRLTELELADRASARRTVFYLALFPTAFFFSAVYTESLFLLLSVATMYFARRQYWLAAALTGMLASATRNLGIVLWALVTWEWLRRHGWSLQGTMRRQTWSLLLRDVKAHWTELVIIAAIPLGLLLYMAFLEINFDRPLAFIEVQAAWGRQNIGPGAVLARELSALADFQLNRGSLNRLLNLSFALIALAMTPFIWRRLGEGYAVYTLVLILVPLFSSVASVMRYVLPLFPTFILLGWWGRRPTLDQFLTAGFAVGLGVLTTVFANWYFVA
ncbi:MAG: hypothetical protein NZM18_08915 [Thermoflexales bacterium]|nr:hypothetical protein [Thermoflexales bacterium]